MARRTTLTDLIAMLRSEVRDAPNTAFGVNVRESYAALLRRHQKLLWEQVDWPHMKVFGDKALQAGARYYDPPSNPSMPLDRVKNIWHRWGSQWLPLRRGIPRRLYGVQDSDADERSDPPRRWDYYNGAAGDQLEIWPIPASNGNVSTLQGYLRFEGVKALAPLIADADRADLDDTMIVLFAAAELLAARGAKDAEAKANMGRTIFNRLKANSQNDTPMLTTSGGVADAGVHHGGDGARWVYDDHGKPHMVR